MNNQKILFKAIVGSQAYNLATEESDTDRRGVYLETSEQIYGLKKAEPSHFPEDPNDTTYPFKHFISLLSKGNPNIIELCFLRDEFIEYIHPLFKKYVIDSRERFISKTLVKSYLGYATHQMHLVEKNGRERYSVNNYDGKAAMHMARLFLQLNNLVSIGDPLVYVDHKDKIFLMNVRLGKVYATLDHFRDQVSAWEIVAKDHINSSKLKDTVDFDWVNNMMIEFYKEVYNA